MSPLWAFCSPCWIGGQRTALGRNVCTRRGPTVRMVMESAAVRESEVVVEKDEGGFEKSAIQTLEDVEEIVQLAAEFDLGDLRVEHEGVVVEVSRSGGRGFHEGVLREKKEIGSVVSGGAEVVQEVPDVMAMQEMEDEEEEEEEATELVAQETEVEASEGGGYESDFIVTSNRVGFFFSGAKNKPPLVMVGDKVEFNQPVCIIEQLGQQYVYLSEASGTVVEIFVEDGDAVEYGQQVMVIRPG